MEDEGLRVALICASNQNRSMAAHDLFVRNNVPNVSSFGTNTRVKLPGLSIDRPIVYEFGVPYEQMAADLIRMDEELYTSKGLVSMLERNSKVKRAPQRFQVRSFATTAHSQDTKEEFDYIITFEERVMDLVVSTLSDRDMNKGQPVHVFNLQTVDNHENAEEGAKQALSFSQILFKYGGDWQENIDFALKDFYEATSITLLHSVCFY